MKKCTLFFILMIACLSQLAWSQTASSGFRSHQPWQMKAGSAVPRAAISGNQAATPENPAYWVFDSSYLYAWVDATTSWKHTESNYMSRDAGGKLLANTYVVLDEGSGQWINYTRYVYNYPAGSGSYDSYSVQAWNTATNSWVDYSYFHMTSQGLMDEYYYKVFDRTTNRFTYGYRQTTSYDTATHLPLQSIREDLDTATDSWVNSGRTTNVYTGFNQLQIVTDEIWSSGSWKNFYRSEYTYDASQFLTGRHEYVWNDAGSTWADKVRITYTNDTTGRPLTILTELYIASVWKNNILETYQYDMGGKETQLLRQIWDSLAPGWVNSYLNTYTYFPNNMMETSNENGWNAQISTWMPTYFYTQDSLGYTLEYYSKYIDYNTYTYSGGYRYVYSYGLNHQMTGIMNYTWNVGPAGWLETARYTYTYDANQNRTEELREVYDTTLTSWKNDQKWSYFYHDLSGIPGHQGIKELCMYANPLHPGESISCPMLKSGSDYRFELYTVTGSKVMDARFRGGESIQIPSGIADGIYVMQLWEGRDILATGKVIVSD